MGAPRIPESTIAEIRRLRATGLSARLIAAQVGVSHKTVDRYAPCSSHATKTQHLDRVLAAARHHFEGMPLPGIAHVVGVNVRTLRTYLVLEDFEAEIQRLAEAEDKELGIPDDLMAVSRGGIVRWVRAA